MRRRIAQLLDWPYAVHAASAITLLLGYFFTFVWAPHPWSWQGIDSYHELAKSLARGETFQTTDVPWGYAYYAAFFYRVFGDRIWVPIVVQATLNAAVPVLLYRLVQPLAGRRVATLAALFAGVFSFNTIYASTQSSDTICTVLFLLALLLFERGLRDPRLSLFAASGVLLGIVPQFRPNLVLLPAVMIGLYVIVPPRTMHKLTRAVVFSALVLAMQMPWIVRNYQLTGLILPTSTHGGVQLWYGTLQVGEHLESRAHNPRFYFASPAFTYTSLWKRPIIIKGVNRDCFNDPNIPTRLIYWTDRDPQHREVVAPKPWYSSAGVTYEVPAQPNHTTLYYYFEQARPATADAPAVTFATPFDGERDPMIAFISDDHLGDLDTHGDVLDFFDLVRMLRHAAWGEDLRNEARLDLTHDGIVDQADLAAYVALMVPELAGKFSGPVSIQADANAVRLNLPDGSWISVPRQFGGRQDDVDVSLDGEMAPALLARNRTFTSLTYPPRRARPGECEPAADITFNGPFYLGEPHMMQRYMALAFDNINRDRSAFIRASLYRMIRLFVVRGTDDVNTSQQFRWSSVVYGVGTLLSLGYLAVFLGGVLIAYRRRSALLLFLVPIVYVPVTIGFVLTNMRYTVTVQPLMFAFVAMAIAAALRLDAPDGAGGTSGSGSRNSG